MNNVNLNYDVNKRSTMAVKFTELSMDDMDFYDRIHSTITASHALTWDIPTDAFFDITIQCAKFFWEWSQNATEELYYFLPSSEILKFGKGVGYSVPLPQNIQNVFQFKPSSSIYGGRLANFMKMNLLQTYTYSAGGYGYGVGNGFRGAYKNQPPSMSNITIQLMEFSQYKEIYGKTVMASFNTNSSKLNIRGSVDYNGLVLGVFERLPIEFLYNDITFEKYVKACCEEQLGIINSVYDFPLIGNVKINYEKIHQRGQKDKDKIESDLEKSNNTDFIFFK